MKKYIYFLFAAALLILSAGCSKDDDGPAVIDSGIVGEWRQTKWNNEAQADFDIYIEFLSDGTFNIYQKVETSAYMRYSGNFTPSAGGTTTTTKAYNGDPTCLIRKRSKPTGRRRSSS